MRRRGAAAANDRETGKKRDPAAKRGILRNSSGVVLSYQARRIPRIVRAVGQAGCQGPTDRCCF
jgi:hypothetical protein